MIHGYHVVFGAYGFWLPNDPRGSWSDFVKSWELRRFGEANKGIERSRMTPEMERQLREAKAALKYPPVQFTQDQIASIAKGFGNAIEKSNFTVWRCSILEEHVHATIARHTFKIEYIVGLLKGEATKQLKADSLHPLASMARGDEQPPTPWNQKCWRSYLNSETDIENAINYVEQNPVKEGLPLQNWDFERPFQGLDKAWITYH